MDVEDAVLIDEMYFNSWFSIEHALSSLCVHLCGDGGHKSPHNYSHFFEFMVPTYFVVDGQRSDIIQEQEGT